MKSDGCGEWVAPGDLTLYPWCVVALCPTCASKAKVNA